MYGVGTAIPEAEVSRPRTKQQGEHLDLPAAYVEVAPSDAGGRTRARRLSQQILFHFGLRGVMLLNNEITPHH